MNFEEFENSFTKENRALKIALATTLIVSAITCIMILFQQRYFLYKGKEIFEERIKESGSTYAEGGSVSGLDDLIRG
jgi:hypothetical protein